jgi:predicted nuclease with TOPRIM domain
MTNQASDLISKCLDQITEYEKGLDEHINKIKELIVETEKLKSSYFAVNEQLKYLATQFNLIVIEDEKLMRFANFSDTIKQILYGNENE